MKTAQELYEISKRRTPEIVAKILYGAKEHIIQRCEEEADKGSTNYTIYLNQGLIFYQRFIA